MQKPAAAAASNPSSKVTIIPPEIWRKADSRPILYGASEDEKMEPGAVPRDVISAFLTECSELIQQDEVITALVDASATKQLPLDGAAMEFQRDVMEFNHGIQRDFGCKYLSQLPNFFPDDKELIDLAVRITLS
jgi:hypothetical protein